jgi:integrase
MAWVRKSRPKTKVVKRRLVDGTVKEYTYERKPPAPRFPGNTVTALIERFRRTPTWVGYAANTKAGYEMAFKVLERRGGTLVQSVTRADLIDTYNGLALRYPAKARNFIAYTRALFAHAVDIEWIDTNPALRIKTVSIGNWTAWTPAQAKVALDRLPEHLRRVVILALYTGQRRGDLIAMGWTAYDGASIRLVQQKTKRALVIPVHPALKTELDSWERKATTILVNSKERPWGGSALSHSMSAALDALGLPEDLNMHGIRKLSGRNLAEAGCSAFEVMAVLGHRSLAHAQLYTESADQERLAGAAIVRLQRVRNGK